jgi:PIN like domain
MRILLDECVPRKLRRELPGHDVRTVTEMGWSRQKDKDLLALMAGAGFEVLLTVDQGIPYQQNLGAGGVAVVVLIASSNQLADLIPLMSSVLITLTTISPGDSIQIGSPS